MVTEATIYGRRFVTYNLHFESKGKDSLRLHQLQQLLEDARGCTETSLVILGGDFNLNAGNGDAGAALHRAGFHDAVRLPEFPTTVGLLPFRSPGCIDWIFASNEVHSKGQVHNGIRASDHYPVSAKIEMR